MDLRGIQPGVIGPCVRHHGVHHSTNQTALVTVLTSGPCGVRLMEVGMICIVIRIPIKRTMSVKNSKTRCFTQLDK